MAKKVVNTGAGAVKFIKPDYIVATLFDGTETDESAPKGDSYILEDVIEDTTSISQDDNDMLSVRLLILLSFPLLNLVSGSLQQRLVIRRRNFWLHCATLQTMQQERRLLHLRFTKQSMQRLMLYRFNLMELQWRLTFSQRFSSILS